MSTNKFPEIFSLQGEVAVITGGGTGLGLGIAQAMHAAGAQVVLLGRREAELARAVQDLGSRASYFVHDVTQLDQAPELAARLAAQVGPVTCLVHNAGINMKKPALETTTEDFQKILSTHVLGSHALTCAIAPDMVRRKQGSILFIASMASLFGIPQVVAYSAAKSAFLGMVRTLAVELSPNGVRVNAIAPGWIDTAMSQKAMAGDPARKNKIIGRTPLARFGESDDIGWAAVYLTSPAAKFVTGTILPVDGGVSVGF